MLRFSDYLAEKVLNIGLNPKHEKHREGYRKQIHDVIQRSYRDVEGGYGGHGSGSDAESKAIHADISDNAVKATRRGDKITHATIYKQKHGRKIIGLGTDGSRQGSADFDRNAREDNKQKRAWGEFSGNAEKAYRKREMPQVSSSEAGKLTGKKVKVKDADRYSREIGGKEHEKTILGHPKY